MTAKIRYKFGRVSESGAELIVGNIETPNPIKASRKLILPLDKLKVGESLFFNKAEMQRWEWILARDTAKRFNKTYESIFSFVESVLTLEIVRIK